MPGNRARRVRVSRVDPVAEVNAWGEIFDAGYDFFGEAQEFGIALDEHGRADEETARAAWRRLGAFYLARRTIDPSRPPWALERFGQPPCR